MTQFPAPLSSPRPAPLRPWMTVVASAMVAVGVVGVLGAVALWIDAMENDDPLAGIGFLLAVLLVLWTCVPAVLGALVLALRHRWPGGSRVMVWVCLGWHGVWLMLASAAFLPGYAPA